MASAASISAYSRERAGAAAHDAIARLEAGDAGADRDDLARAFAADRLPGAGLAVQAMAEHELAAVERGGMHAHQQLAAAPAAGTGVSRSSSTVAVSVICIHQDCIVASLSCPLAAGEDRLALLHEGACGLRCSRRSRSSRGSATRTASMSRSGEAFRISRVIALPAVTVSGALSASAAVYSASSASSPSGAAMRDHQAQRLRLRGVDAARGEEQVLRGAGADQVDQVLHRRVAVAQAQARGRNREHRIGRTRCGCRS